MKHNLANRPKAISGMKQIPNATVYEAWFESFEKELREHLATIGTFEYKRPHQRMRSRTTEVGKFIKEILGGTKK